jgi:Leucine-rich repeat (LRR) protein
VKDLTPLTNSEIEILYISNTQVISLMPLETMKKLSGLTINNTPAAALPAPPAVKVILDKSKKGKK